MSEKTRLVLGTAQLGMPYGIGNRAGQPSLDQVRNMVKIAWKHGIRQFDTAQAYGRSEEILGQVLQNLGLAGQAKIITKLGPKIDHLDPQTVQTAVENSLRHLCVPTLYCLMLHDESLLELMDRGLKKILLDIIQGGQAKHIGVSVYSPRKALQAVESDIVDFIQVPTNILDSRFEKAGIFDLARQKKKKIYIRSVFLQGLINLKESEVPDTLEYARPIIRKLEELAKELSMSRKEMALNYVKLRFRDAQVIFGAETPKQVRENTAMWMSDPPDTFLTRIIDAFPAVDERILHPPSWFS
jgi:aryl-alcohol dehydrogenase-like predicted oxidoreductase